MCCFVPWCIQRRVIIESGGVGVGILWACVCLAMSCIAYEIGQDLQTIAARFFWMKLYPPYIIADKGDWECMPMFTPCNLFGAHCRVDIVGVDEVKGASLRNTCEECGGAARSHAIPSYLWHLKAYAVAVSHW